MILAVQFRLQAAGSFEKKEVKEVTKQQEQQTTNAKPKMPSGIWCHGCAYAHTSAAVLFVAVVALLVVSFCVLLLLLLSLTPLPLRLPAATCIEKRISMHIFASFLAPFSLLIAFVFVLVAFIMHFSLLAFRKLKSTLAFL